MEFLFFDAADMPLFSRADAESAEWVQEELSLRALFPYDPQKVIQRGMRIGFTDETGNFQPFEVRKIINYEPDHYQELTCEHIAVAELTDEHFAGIEFTNIAASTALQAMLSGTLWSVGNVETDNRSSADLGMSSVWQCTRTIEQNWNVYITPRVTFDASGITGRYLDISQAQGTWRGVRLSLDKNADEMGVTIDDTNVLTALYGYGASQENGQPLSFKDVVWEPDDPNNPHPYKPGGQAYLEDPYSTTHYGRNGRPRFGFYQNADITDPYVLLEKTWEALKATNRPQVTIDCMVRDLYRLGYADQPLRLHDTALVEIRPMGEKMQLEIIRLTVNLLDPTATRPTIGAYIPNIIYIQRQTAESASGSAADTTTGRRGGGGSGGKSAMENIISEFETEIAANQYEISLRAYQRDMTNVENILRQAGMSINAQGVLIYADDNPNMLGAKLEVQAGEISSLVTKTGVDSLGASETLYSKITQNADGITSEVSRATGAESALSSRITQNADNISLVVSNGSISAASIVAAINAAGSSVKISADNIELDGATIASFLSGQTVEVGVLTVARSATIDSLTVSNEINAVLVDTQFLDTDSLDVAGTTFESHTISLGSVASGTFLGTANLSLAHYHAISATANGGIITITQGAEQATPGSANFNIADTQFYRDGVSAAEASVTISTISAAWSYSPTTHRYTVTATAEASNGNHDSQAFVSGTSAYDGGFADGAASVTISYITFGWSYSPTTHRYTVTATAEASNAATGSQASASSTDAYDYGYDDGYDVGYDAGQASISVTGSDIRLGSASSSTGALDKTATTISGYIWWNSPTGWDSLRDFTISTGMAYLSTPLYYYSGGSYVRYTDHALYYKL